MVMVHLDTGVYVDEPAQACPTPAIEAATVRLSTTNSLTILSVFDFTILIITPDLLLIDLAQES